MALIDSTRLRNEIQKMDFGILSVEIQRAFDRLVADQPTEEKNPVIPVCEVHFDDDRLHEMVDGAVKQLQEDFFFVPREEAVQIYLEKRSDGERKAYMQGWKAGLESGKRQMLGQRAIKGRWIVNKDGDKICSHCKTGTSRETNACASLFVYCPYCGSDNRKRGEEQ